MLALAGATGLATLLAGFGAGRALLWAVAVLVVCQIAYFAYLAVTASRLPRGDDDGSSGQ